MNWPSKLGCAATKLFDLQHHFSIARDENRGLFVHSVTVLGDEVQTWAAQLFMTKRLRRISAVVLLILFATGCGSSDATTRPIMTEAQHSHYHVHAPDVKHDHTHPEGVVGGHSHAHQH